MTRRSRRSPVAGEGSDAPLVFEVVYQPFVAVRIGPDKTRPLQARFFVWGI